MLEKAFHQHSSQHQGTTSVVAQPVHLMHTSGAHQYPCTTTEKKNPPGGQLYDFFDASLWPQFFSDQASEFFSLAVFSFIQDRSFCSSRKCSKKPRNNEDKFLTQIKLIMDVLLSSDESTLKLFLQSRFTKNFYNRSATSLRTCSFLLGLFCLFLSCLGLEADVFNT